MSNPLSRSVSLVLFLALAIPTTVLAQTAGTADLHGVILDKSGKPVAGYPWHLITPENSDVVMKPTEDGGIFGVTGLPPGNYEIRVFDPGGSTDKPIASKQVTLAAGQKEKIEIRLGSDTPKGGAASKAAGALPVGATTIGTTGVNWTIVQVVGLALLVSFLVFFVMRSRQRPTA